MPLTQEAIKILTAPIPKSEIKTKSIQGNTIRFTDLQFVESRLAQADPSFEKVVEVSPKAITVHYIVLGVKRGASADIVDVKGYGSPVKNAEAQAAKRAAARFGVAAELWDKEAGDAGDEEEEAPRRTAQASKQNSGGSGGPSDAQAALLGAGSRSRPGLQVPVAVIKKLTGGRDGTASLLITELIALKREAGDEYEADPPHYIERALKKVDKKLIALLDQDDEDEDED